MRDAGVSQIVAEMEIDRTRNGEMHLVYEVRRCFPQAFTDGLMMGLAACCVNLAREGAATPQAGMMMELDAIAAVALGGTPLTGGYGNIIKTIVCALTLTTVCHGLTIAGVLPSWSQFAPGLLLIAAIAISLNLYQGLGKRW